MAIGISTFGLIGEGIKRKRTGGNEKFLSIHMAKNSTECLNTEGQDNTYGEANQQSTFAPSPATDPQIAAALAQAYSQFTIVLKRIPEAPHLSGEPIPLTRLTNLNDEVAVNDMAKN
ncbi:hypothetical protein JCGZ_08732 [Jatropha curcas]|uniref:Uncharacterized protein n=1 Tax=Jatropha curcas TaxID=180498 RepID=A0A067KM55_JATCU|nr:hypothetical protein JCGZ_08732 [Jatropha curcas]